MKKMFIALVALPFLSVASTNTQTKQQPTIEFSQSSDELERRGQPVTEEDLQILKRADQILLSPTVWNRHDTRVCKPEDKTWSLFCAMEKASLDVLGEYRHREVALQEVRFAVEDATKGIEFTHRMMDYNNLPSTRFSDIKQVLKTATGRVSARLAAQKKKGQSK
jgi:isocitrate/isopropylmalate dehydrogenase